MKYYSIVRGLLILIIVFVGGCAQTDPRLKKSGAFEKGFMYSDVSFKQYIEETRNTIASKRVFFDERQKEKEIKANSPFEYVPTQKNAVKQIMVFF
jgi:hypothetical protein